MPYIQITKEAQQRLRSLAEEDFHETARPSTREGYVNIPVSAEVKCALEDELLPGEDFSDAIIRLTSKKQ